ncbi:MAG TPA: DNA-3-methyladenine glycosylase, partial [Nitrolancea sp.]
LAPDRALATAWYERSVVEVARELLGCLLVSTHGDATVSGVIVETEAYDGEDDPACHSAFRRTGVVRAMWGQRGTAYVYRAYGMYPCFNVVAGPGQRPAAVLIRALQPLQNLETMSARTDRKADARVSAGPGLTGRALGIDLSDNGRSLQSAPLWIQPGTTGFEIVSGPRIGITRGVDAEWRFGVRGSPSLSRRFS